MTVVNTTPHDVIVENDFVKELFTKASNPARASEKVVRIAQIDGIPIYKCELDEVIGLPEEKQGTYYIVSQMIRNMLPDRKDLLVPYIFKRDSNGNILSCEGFKT